MKKITKEDPQWKEFLEWKKSSEKEKSNFGCMIYVIIAIIAFVIYLMNLVSIYKRITLFIIVFIFLLGTTLALSKMILKNAKESASIKKNAIYVQLISIVAILFMLITIRYLERSASESIKLDDNGCHAEQFVVEHKESVNIRSSHSTKSKIIKKLRSGECVDVISFSNSTQNDWKMVISGSDTGFIKSSFIKQPNLDTSRNKRLAYFDSYIHDFKYYLISIMILFIISIIVIIGIMIYDKKKNQINKG